MVKLLFLLPVIMCIAWFSFLQHFRIPLQQGKKGFVYIAIFNAVLALVLWILLLLTRP